jgi:hypothetical protein
MCCLIFVAEMMYGQLPMRSPISPSLVHTFARLCHLYDLRLLDTACHRACSCSRSSVPTRATAEGRGSTGSSASASRLELDGAVGQVRHVRLSATYACCTMCRSRLRGSSPASRASTGPRTPATGPGHRSAGHRSAGHRSAGHRSPGPPLRQAHRFARPTASPGPPLRRAHRFARAHAPRASPFREARRSPEPTDRSPTKLWRDARDQAVRSGIRWGDRDPNPSEGLARGRHSWCFRAPPTNVSFVSK